MWVHTCINPNMCVYVPCTHVQVSCRKQWKLSPLLHKSQKITDTQFLCAFRGELLEEVLFPHGCIYIKRISPGQLKCYLPLFNKRLKKILLERNLCAGLNCLIYSCFAFILKGCSYRENKNILGVFLVKE